MIMKCVCGGILGFLKDYENGKVPDDVTSFRCPCGCMGYVIDGTVWDTWYPLTTNKEQ